MRFRGVSSLRNASAGMVINQYPNLCLSDSVGLSGLSPSLSVEGSDQENANASNQTCAGNEDKKSGE